MAMISILLAATLTFTPQDANVAYRTAKQLVDTCTPRDAGTPRAKSAANCILDAASIVGADVRRDVFTAATPKGERTFVNLMAEFCSRPDSPWVVIVSHYDTKPGVDCPGANDGASTTGLLVGLANALCDWRTPRGNVMLIWTDGEECMEAYGEQDGLWGSKRAAAVLKQRGIDVKAVICLDMLGDRDLGITIPRNGSPALANIACYAAKKIGEPGLVQTTSEIVKDDHTAFLAAGFKAVDLIDFKYGSAPGLNDFWHTPEDTVDKISVKSLERSGRVVVEMLNVLLI